MMRVVVVLLSVLWVTQSEKVSEKRHGPAMEDFSSSLRRFTGYMYVKVAEHTPASENIFFSPLSIAEGMGMVMGGAKGETYQEMAEALHINPQMGYSRENIVNLFRKVYNKVFNMTKITSESQALMASKAFIKNGYQIKQEYEDILENFFDAEIEPINFQNAAKAAQIINDWVAAKTGDMIKELIEPDGIGALTRMILVNALYFQAKWKTEMGGKHLQDGKFHTPDKTKTVPFMGMNERVLYKSDDEALQVLLPYDKDEAYMRIIMPRKGEMESVSRYTKLLRLLGTYSPPSEWRTSLPNTKFSMPMFEFDQTLNMKEVLQRMNVRDLFDQNKADLSGITESERLYVDLFTHKAKITVDDKGTIAAAATGIGMSGRSAGPMPIIINRPFLFAIYRREQILFFGRVSDPVAPAIK